MTETEGRGEGSLRRSETTRTAAIPPAFCSGRIKKLHRRAADAVLLLLCLQILVLEGLSAFCVISNDVAVSDQAVLVSNQTVQTYRTSCVELACADADFSSEAVTESVSESGRAVLVNAC